MPWYIGLVKAPNLVRCGCWWFILPDIDNLDLFPPDDWTVTGPTSFLSFGANTGPSGTTLVDTTWLLHRTYQGLCDELGYTATVAINDIPLSTISGLQAITVAKVALDGPPGVGLDYQSDAFWNFTWCGFHIELTVTAAVSREGIEPDIILTYFVDTKWTVIIPSGLTVTLDGTPWTPGTYDHPYGSVTIDNSLAGLWEISYTDGGGQVHLSGAAEYESAEGVGSFDGLVAGMRFELEECECPCDWVGNVLDRTESGKLVGGTWTESETSEPATDFEPMYINRRLTVCPPDPLSACTPTTVMVCVAGWPDGALAALEANVRALHDTVGGHLGIPIVQALSWQASFFGVAIRVYVTFTMTQTGIFPHTDTETWFVLWDVEVGGVLVDSGTSSSTAFPIATGPWFHEGGDLYTSPLGDLGCDISFWDGPVEILDAFDIGSVFPTFAVFNGSIWDETNMEREC